MKTQIIPCYGLYRPPNPKKIAAQKAIVNAAAGPWQKGPEPIGQEGDQYLFLYGNDLIMHVKWSGGYWYDFECGTHFNPDKFARINLPQIDEEVTE